MPALTPHALRARMDREPDLVVVDVRDTVDHARVAIPGSCNEPFDEHTAARLARAIPDRRRPVVFVCGWGHRSAVAAIALRREGFSDVSYLDGGLEAWGCAALPVVSDPGGAAPG